MGALTTPGSKDDLERSIRSMRRHIETLHVQASEMPYRADELRKEETEAQRELDRLAAAYRRAGGTKDLTQL